MDRWIQRAMEHGRVWETAYRWSKTQFVNQSNEIVTYETDRLYAFTVAAGEKKYFVFPRLDISEEYQTQHRMVTNVQMGEEYLVVCDEGDMWEFQGSHGHADQKAIINVITTAFVDNGGAFQLKEHRFPHEIPFNYRVHLFVKAGREYFVRPLPAGDKLEQCLIDKFPLPKNTNEVKVVRPTTYHEIKRHINSSSLKIMVSSVKPNTVANYPYSDVLLFIS